MSTTFDVPAAKRHVLGLVAEHRLVLSWCQGVYQAEAYPAARAVTLPRIRGARTYLVALHEIGHAVSGSARRLYARFDFPGEFACEAWAWSWACESVPPEIAAAMTDRDWAVPGWFLGTYSQRVGQELRGLVALP